MKNAIKILAAVLSASFGIFCLFSADSVKAAVSDGINRCITIIIPSLYAMMAVSGILINSGMISYAGRILRPISRLIFGINGELAAIFFFSALSGYPIGAKMIYSQYTNGCISKKDAELLSGLCFGSGGAFIFGCAAANFSLGRLILISTISANTVMALIMSAYFRRHIKSAENSRNLTFSAEIFTGSVNSAGRSMAEICFCILVFSALSAMLGDLGILPKIASLSADILNISYGNAEAFLYAVLDVTSITKLTSGGFAAVPTIAALISFGGICVFLQIASIFKGKLSTLPMIVMRTAAAFLSYVICRILMPFFITEDSVSVLAVTGRLHKETSPVPSVMLIFMTAFLIAESGKIKKLLPKEQLSCK